jgi:very-short-patch-repair endonuclease
MSIISASYRELRAEGMTRAEIARSIHVGTLLRARRDTYLRAGVSADVLNAVQLGGRLDCLSLLDARGIFAHDRALLHVQFERAASRLPARGGAVRGHWRSSVAAPRATHAPLLEALVQSASCQPPRSFVASLDSAWNMGLNDERDVHEIFQLLPYRFRRLQPLVDPSAGSGPETLVRLMLRALGLRWRSQVHIPGVGRVDFVVEKWLIIECDSKAHHSSWEAQREDRRRDRAAAAAGYVTLRLIAEEILYEPDAVRAAIAGLKSRLRR